MTLPVALVSMFGKPIAEKLINGLSARKGGIQKLEAASAALAQGASAIEALKSAFGKDFLSALNDALGRTGKSRVTYEAGTLGYIRLDDAATKPTKFLRDELNINLDRLALLSEQSINLKNHFLGLMSVWQERCRQFYGETHDADLQSTFDAINQLLSGESKNYQQIYKMLSTTGLGGAGALMVISGALIATGTGMGIVSAITAFFVGVPWITVGALVLPGALLLLLAARKSRPADEMSLSVAMAYKLLERIDATTT